MNGFSASMPNAFTRKQVTLSEGRQLARPIKISAALTDAGLITSQLIAKHEQASQLKPTLQPAAAQQGTAETSHWYADAQQSWASKYAGNRAANEVEKRFPTPRPLEDKSVGRKGYPKLRP
jgi:hypothetical protein